RSGAGVRVLHWRGGSVARHPHPTIAPENGETVMAHRNEHRSLGELFAELSRETGQLVRKEVELATTEMTAKAKKAATGSGIAAAGGALVHAGLLVVLAAIVI